MIVDCNCLFVGERSEPSNAIFMYYNYLCSLIQPEIFNVSHDPELMHILTSV